MSDHHDEHQPTTGTTGVGPDNQGGDNNLQEELQRQQIQALVQQELLRQRLQAQVQPEQEFTRATGESTTSPQHRTEPRQGTGASSTSQTEPNFGRVIKMFKIEPFDGSVEQGAIVSGVATWFTRSEALLEMQEDLHQVRLPERMKNALIFQHLSGAASQWYISNVSDLRLRTFTSLGQELKREFGSKLSKAQIGQLVANEKKENSETYREYSLRLRTMAAATSSDGFETKDSNNLALSSFIVNAWRKHTDNLRMVMREDSSHPVREFDRVISRLCTIAGHQGVLSFPSRQSAPATKLQPSNTSANAKSNLGKRRVAEGEIKREGAFKKRDYSKMRCGT